MRRSVPYILPFLLMFLTLFSVERGNAQSYTARNQDSTRIKLKVYQKDLSALGTQRDTNRVNALFQIGRCYINLNIPDSVFQIAQQMRNLSDSLNFGRGQAQSNHFFFEYYYMQDQFDKALHYNVIALELSLKYSSKSDQARYYLMNANTHNRKGNHEQSLDSYFKALTIYEDMEDPVSMATVYNNIGLLYQDHKEFDKALMFYKKSGKQDSITGDKKSIATTLNNLGGVYQDLQKFDTALTYFKQAMALYEELDYKKGLAHGYNNIGITYYYDGKIDKCLEYFEKSLYMRKKIGIKVDVAQSYNNIGVFYMYEEQFDKALVYSDSSFVLAKEIGTKVEIMDALSVQFECQYQLKQYKKAYDLLTTYNLYQDSVYQENKQNAIAELETKYDTEKKEKQIEIQNLELKSQDVKIQKERALSNFYFASGIGAVIILIMVGYSLFQKRKANELLTEQKYEIEEKNEELNQQNEEIIAIGEKIEMQNDVLSKQNTDILSSISYAKRIQEAILPPDKTIHAHFSDAFVLYKPKDIVSGDFYWMQVVGDTIFWAVVDCTGHGVPGALMSIVGAHGLKKIVVDNGISDPVQILNDLTSHVIESVADSKDGRAIMDGMDIALCCLNKSTGVLEFAGAYNPLIQIRNNELNVFKGVRKPIGRYVAKINKPFIKHTVEVQPGDCYYMFSDGYVDQFSEETGGKYTQKVLKAKLLDIHMKSMSDQKDDLQETFRLWRGRESQLDDVCLMGVRI